MRARSLFITFVVLALPAGVPAQGPCLPGWQPAAGVVFVASGSGDDLSMPENFQAALAAARAPLVMEVVRWSRFANIAFDHVDQRGHFRAAQDLADRVRWQRLACPWGRIYLVSHSAGSHVVLAAAELLPPETIDRIVLLAPSVSRGYDLRLALRAAREGIDCFCSSKDLLLLFAADAVGSADGKDDELAGVKGFRFPPPWVPDAFLYRKLRHHFWEPVMVQTGHHGRHYGVTQPSFVRTYVLPVMFSSLSALRVPTASFGHSPRGPVFQLNR